MMLRCANMCTVHVQVQLERVMISNFNKILGLLLLVMVAAAAVVVVLVLVFLVWYMLGFLFIFAAR